jgi:GH25 family lysozyme M1 (1,4-beta-N-acetylmuramidase)
MTAESGPWGVDVASWQGQVDWASVAGAGCSFAWTKATEDDGYLNPTFAANWAGIASHGMVRGAYHFARPDAGDADPREEADYFCSAVLDQGLSPGDLLALDLEAGSGPLAHWTLAFMARCHERVGFDPLLYTGRWFIDDHQLSSEPRLAQYGLWLAAYQAEVPATPQPWASTLIWQFTSDGSVPGISGAVDCNRLLGPMETLTARGMPGGGITPSVPLPRYDAGYPVMLQQHDWDCSQESADWCLHAYGRRPTEAWMESQMIAEGVVSRELGLLDASGSQLAAFLNRHYQEFGYVAEHDGDVSFDDLAAEAAAGKHPIAAGGRGWYHWSAVRGWDDMSKQLQLANPAPGYRSIYQTLDRDQFERLGPFSMVRLTHPAAESTVPTTPPTYHVGQGILDSMAAHGDTAGSDEVYFKHGSTDEWSEAIGTSGARYIWVPSVARVFYYPPN